MLPFRPLAMFLIVWASSETVCPTRHALGLDQLPRLFLHQVLQFFGVLPQLPAHADPLARPLQGDFENFVVDRLGDEIGGVVFEALDGKVHVAVAGEHDHFGVRAFGLDVPQELDAVHAGHFDVGQHDGRRELPEHPQGLRPVFGRRDRVAGVREGDAEHRADPGLVIHQ
jgi:hypothetical protein